MLTKAKIIQEVKEKGTVKSSDFIDRFNVSRQYVSKLLSSLVDENVLIKIGSTRLAFYTTEEFLQKNPKFAPNSYSKILTNKNLEEHRIFNDMEKQFIPVLKISENVKSIFEYAFSEMLNNAIEHSTSKKIKIFVSLNNEILTCIVDDFGVGAFRNIMQKKHLDSEIEAIQDLLKGKTTTAPKLHSGEGIFFTSKVGDEFILDSYGYQFIANNIIKDIFIKKVKGQKQGTKVTFRININDRHHLNDVFKKYTNIGEDSDYGFDKTEIRVRLYIMGGVHISRSQARRVLSGLDKFKVIVMDYEKVPTVGQAFADEIYRVFKNRKPDIEIQSIHMNESVKFMVERAQNEAKKEN
ncbi:MAG: histidine kinase [Candidatus Ryanbacteria bacterium CG10_big_fil_rev_8_21_14_0_10_43_42]|uniref:Histidine kinase n=1 Tax=Candidatus Ryanbacteria bacterium CG10_big_fil_rev_8_21_14_0_10_43_42 TaxID=1974864 RepID=A0A2M8KYB7_9BACT|nr:MAG: histidine kinase [Candidatus Ryanbacteria bacterium CG10_big_fil_rev_8_21_14_0_10_43_42]